MSLNLEQKQAVVAEVAQVAAKAYSAIAADYRGITVESLTGLRVKARNSGVYLRVVKNTLARRSLEGTEFACRGPQLKGPLVLAFSQEDPGAAARVLEEFEVARVRRPRTSAGGATARGAGGRRPRGRCAPPRRSSDRRGDPAGRGTCRRAPDRSAGAR